MQLEYQTLELLRQNHPAWRLLCSPQAPLIAAFFSRVFLAPNIRAMSQADLVEALEDELYGTREKYGEEKFPRSASAYLNDWADNAKGWLRKYYPEDSDEPHFDLTPATEKALSWLSGLTRRSFVGTESRLMTLFELLRQIREGSETDPKTRIIELEKRRDSITEEIERIKEGDINLLGDTGVKDRFQQFQQLARELLRDFREVEHNFRILDRKVRERLTLWDGAKGDLLEEILGQRDAIVDSDQGRSFRAFWDFLMSQRRQEELTEMLDHILQLPPVKEMQPESRLNRVHYDWLEAGEHTQRTVARLSQQLRRFLDDQAWLENRRIMDILHNIETRGLAIRNTQPPGTFMELPDNCAAINLPLERPLYKPPVKPVIEDIMLKEGDSDISAEALYAQTMVDISELSLNIRKTLQQHAQISLAELTLAYPFQHGLSELIAYLQLASTLINTIVDDDIVEHIHWQTEDGRNLSARLPRIIFCREAA